MNESKVKRVFWVGLAFIVSLIGIGLYYNRGYTTFISRSQITSVSPDQCSFSFNNSANQRVNVILTNKPNSPKLLDLLKDKSTLQIHTTSKSNITELGEVISDVWIDGVQISCDT